jgi:hypothetical protein
MLAAAHGFSSRTVLIIFLLIASATFALRAFG